MRALGFQSGPAERTKFIDTIKLDSPGRPKQKSKDHVTASSTTEGGGGGGWGGVGGG